MKATRRCTRAQPGTQGASCASVTGTVVIGKPAASWCLLLVLCVAVAPSCRPRESEQTRPPAAPQRAATGSIPRVVVLGDSLSAGLGVRKEEAYPAVLQERLRARGYEFEVVNAGVSGDTTAGGLRRLDWALEGDVRILVVALGANDGLRGLPVDQMKRNLAEIIVGAGRRGVAVLLAGMEAPPNYGEEYTRDYREAFRALAREHNVAFVPFLLQDVAGVSELNQADGLHPTPEGARKVADNLWPTLERMVASGRKP
jgi:acyl-CoA thioesterase-1